MSRIRSLVLISSDPYSINRGAHEVFERVKEEVSRLGLQEEIEISMIRDTGRHDVAPLVIIYT